MLILSNNNILLILLILSNNNIMLILSDNNLVNRVKMTFSRDFSTDNAPLFHIGQAIL